jgi:transposase InsO family protein
MLDDLLLTQFINGLHDSEMQKKLLTDNKLTFEKAIQTSLLYEAANKPQSNPPHAMCSPEINAVVTQNRQKKNMANYICYSCNKRGHLRAKCRFQNAKCECCGKTGHISSACNLKNSKPVSAVLTESNDTTYDIKFDSSYVQCNNLLKTGSMIYKTLLVDGKPITFLIDTGSPVTIIPRHLLSSDKVIQRTESNIKCYNGSKLPSMGTTNVTLTHNDKSVVIEVLVIQGTNMPLLGCNAIDQFSLITVAPIICNESRGIMAEIIPKANFENVMFPKYKPRSLPFSLKQKVEEDIADKVKNNILVPVEKPLMACPIVPVSKANGAVRICGDYSVTANKYIDAEQYVLPTLEELSTAMVNCTVFSKLDLKNAYLQLPLSPDSQKFTTISTTMGFFNFTKLPFGISSAPRIFQQFIDKIIQIDTVKAYQDDILIGGYTEADHNLKLQQVVDILVSHNLTINKEKSEIGLKCVHFLGFLLDARGLHPDPQRLMELKNIRSPSNRKELKSIIGTLQFYSRFNKSFSSTASPLFKLLSPKVNFHWTSLEEKALRLIINSVDFSSYLVFYDVSKPLYLSTDASLHGLGAVLSHDPSKREIIHCASRVLTTAEKKYSNIEKEALAVIFGVKKFHQYLAGRHFTIQSDHAPLRFIFDSQKPINDRISSRLQRWCLILKAYNFSIVNIKGEEMFLPDFLSRVHQLPNSVEDELEISFILQEDEIPLFKEIQQHSQFSEIAKIVRYVQKGWPIHVHKKLLPYTRDKYEYTVHNSCLYRGMRVVVPSSLRSKILCLFHEFHPGMAKMRQIMRQFVWWPGMDLDVQKFVNSCETCASNQSSRTNWQLTSWPDCTKFFERLSIDICFYNNKQYLVIVDGFSNFIDVHQLSSLTTSQVVLALRKTFRYFGLPDTLVCDNGSQFLSKEFKEFLHLNSIKLVLTPPYHSQSNGKVERAIRTLKMFLNKNTDNLSIDNFCMSSNFFPNSNGTISCSEYLKLTPRILMKKVLLSDKRGVTSGHVALDQAFHTTVVPLVDGRIAHSGGIIEHSRRPTKPNSRYFNNDFIN